MSEILRSELFKYLIKNKLNDRNDFNINSIFNTDNSKCKKSPNKKG